MNNSFTTFCQGFLCLCVAYRVPGVQDGVLSLFSGFNPLPPLACSAVCGFESVVWVQSLAYAGVRYVVLSLCSGFNPSPAGVRYVVLSFFLGGSTLSLSHLQYSNCFSLVCVPTVVNGQMALQSLLLDIAHSGRAIQAAQLYLGQCRKKKKEEGEGSKAGTCSSIMRWG